MKYTVNTEGSSTKPIIKKETPVQNAFGGVKIVEKKTPKEDANIVIEGLDEFDDNI